MKKLDVDFEDCLRLLNPNDELAKKYSITARRVHWQLYVSQTFPRNDKDLIKDMLQNQLLPLIEENNPEIHWLLDSLNISLLQMFFGSEFMEDTPMALKVLNVFKDNFMKLDDLDCGCNYQSVKSISYVVKQLFGWQPVTDYLQTTISQEFVSEWGNLSLRFDFGGRVSYIVRNSAVDGINSKENVSLLERFDDSKREKEYEALLQVISPEACLMTDYSPQRRRAALMGVVAAMETLKSTSSSRKQKEAAKMKFEAFTTIAAKLAKLDDFEYLVDLYVKVIKIFQEFLDQGIWADCEWYGESISKAVIPLQYGKTGIVDAIESLGVLPRAVPDLGKFAPQYLAEFIDAIFAGADFVSSQLLMIIAVKDPATCKFAAAKNLEKLLKYAKTDTNIQLVLSTFFSTDITMFAPYVDLVLGIEGLNSRFLVAASQKPDIFQPKDIYSLLPCLKNLQNCNAAEIIMAYCFKTYPELQTKEKFLPIIEEICSPTYGMAQYYAFSAQLIMAIGEIATTKSGATVAADILFFILQKLLNANPRNAQLVSTIPIIMSSLSNIAKFHPDSVQPYEGVLKELEEDPIAEKGSVAESIDHVLNNLHGVSLAALQDKFASSMKSLGINPDDPFFEAVQNSLDKNDRGEYDCMLSYNWNQQQTVIRIHEALTARGYTVWLDLDQMSGNVYGKMADAVLGSKVIIPCLSVSYEASGNCKRELGFAADQTRSGKKIVPVRLDDGPFTWTALITSGLLYTMVTGNETQEQWEKAMDGLAREIAQVVGDRKPTSSVVGADAEFKKAVEESLKKSQDLTIHDCMLSYNWGQQETVIRVRDSLVKRGLTVWIDLELMSGNVYGKMADAVIGSKVIVSCVSTSYEASGNCRRELNFAVEQVKAGKVLIGLELDDGPFTWTDNALAGWPRLKLTHSQTTENVEFENHMDKLEDAIRASILKTQDTISSQNRSDNVITEAPESSAALKKEGCQSTVDISGLEIQIDHLKKLLEKSENQRQRDYQTLQEQIRKQSQLITMLCQFMGVESLEM